MPRDDEPTDPLPKQRTYSPPPTHRRERLTTALIALGGFFIGVAFASIAILLAARHYWP